MKLPFRKNAYIPKEKLTKYLLSETHQVGSAKARFFRGLGFNETNIEKLANLLLQMAQTNDVKKVRKSPFGTNYVIEGTIKSSNGRLAMIVTVWFIPAEKVRPSFVSAYPV